MDTSVFTKNKRYLMLALDHRQSFRKLIDPEDPDSVDADQIVDLKREIIAAAYDQLSGILLDTDYGLEAYASLDFNKPKPFLLTAEKSGYHEKGGERITKIQHDAGALKELGAAGVKLLIYFNPKAESASTQIETAQKVLEGAHEQDLPVFLEVVHYGIRPDVVGSVKTFLDRGVRADVFKLEYPGSLEKCEQVTKVLGKTPWILLTRGENFEEFCAQLETASKVGCKGFLAGRSLWQETLKAEGRKQRKKFLKEVLPTRFERISKIVSRSK